MSIVTLKCFGIGWFSNYLNEWLRTMFLKMAYRNLSRRKARTLLAILAVIIAVSLFSSIKIATNAILYSSYRVYTEHIGDFDVLIYKSRGSPFFNATNISNILSGIREISAFSVRLLFGALLSVDNKTARIVVIGINQTQDSKIGSFEILEGNFELGENRCLVLADISEKMNIHPGKNVTIYYIAGKSLKNATLMVSAIVHQSGKLPIDIKAAIFVDIRDAQKLLSLNDSANIIFIKLNPEILNPLTPENSINSIIAVCERIQELIGLDYTVSPIKATVLLMVSESISSQRIILYSFSSIAVVMAIILVILAATMNLNERVREIGVLRAIGASRSSIFLSIIVEAVVIGVIGSFIGLCIGMSLSSQIFEILVRSEELSYQLILDPLMPLEALGIGVLITILGSIYPAIKASKITPSEALQPAARRIKYFEEIEKKISPKAVNREYIYIGAGISLATSLFVFIIPMLSTLNEPRIMFMALFIVLLVMLLGIIFVLTGLFPKLVIAVGGIFSEIHSIVGNVAKNNVIRYKQRYIVLYFMLTLSVAALIIVGTLVETQMKTVELTIKAQAGADIVIYARSPLPPNVTNMIRNITGVAEICPVTTSVSVKVGDLILWQQANGRLYGIDPINYTRVSFISDFGLDEKTFEKLLNNDSVIISKGLADLLEISEGDKIRLETFRKTIILKVAAVIPIAPGFIFTKFENKAVTGTDLLVSISTYEKIMNTNASYSRIFVKVSPSEDPSEVAEKIQDIVGEEYDIQTISINDYLERIKEAFESLENLLSTLLYFAIAIAILGEGLSVITSVSERIWEIGVLRAIGASRKNVALMFSLEIFLIALLGFISGLISAIMLSGELLIANNAVNEITTPLILPSNTIVSTLLVTIIPSTLLAMGLAYKYSGGNIAEILAKAERL